MKIFNKIMLLLLLIALHSQNLVAQITILTPTKRTQIANQYTSFFICSPNSGTIIQDIHDDNLQSFWPNSDKFQEYNGSNYVQLPEEAIPGPATIMQPGKGYVIQLGGNGSYGTIRLSPEEFDFSNNGTSGGANNGLIVTPLNSGFNLLGNPYNNFLDLDLFLLNNNNRTKIKGPIYLWSHNTLISGANINPNDPTSTYLNSANDFALYNVLGGVASGRQISTSAENMTSTGIQTPNGKICMGTGFGIMAIGSGSVNYDESMRTNSNGGETQSFRLSNQDDVDKSNSAKTAAFVPTTRSRIWLNIESGVPPTSGPNTNPLKQILIGYSPCFGSDCATAGDSDRVFDAEIFTAVSQPTVDFYSFAAGSTKKLAIQGRGDFQNTDFFQLGYKVTTAGTYTITSSSDGIFPAKPYYILDADDPTGQYHTLPYTFTTAAGTFDNRFKVVFENLISITYPVNICDSQISDLQNSVFATQVPGATNYRFQVRTVSDTGPLFGTGIYFGINGPTSYIFNLNLPNIEYNTNYWVSVATYQVNGAWIFGPACRITTPALPPPSFITTPACGSVLPSYWTTIRAQQINGAAIPVGNYRFTVTQNGSTSQQEFAGRQFQLPQIVGLPLIPNTTYTISVDVFWGTTWILGTATCDVITPNFPYTRQSGRDITIFEASAYPNPFANNFKLDINTSSEEQIDLQIFDMLGRQIESRSINISNLDTQEIGENYTSGVYNVIVKQGDNIKTLRMIKR